MKLKNIVIFNADFVSALNHFAKAQLPIKISYPLQKCLKVLQQEEVDLKASRDELIKKYGTKFVTETGEDSWDVNKSKKEDQDKFITEINELMNFEFEIPIENKLTMDLNSLGDFAVSVQHITAMEALIEFKE